MLGRVQMHHFHREAANLLLSSAGAAAKGRAKVAFINYTLTELNRQMEELRRQLHSGSASSNRAHVLREATELAPAGGYLKGCVCWPVGCSIPSHVLLQAL